MASERMIQDGIFTACRQLSFLIAKVQKGSVVNSLKAYRAQCAELEAMIHAVNDSCDLYAHYVDQVNPKSGEMTQAMMDYFDEARVEETIAQAEELIDGITALTIALEAQIADEAEEEPPCHGINNWRQVRRTVGSRTNTTKIHRRPKSQSEEIADFGRIADEIIITPAPLILCSHLDELKSFCPLPPPIQFLSQWNPALRSLQQLLADRLMPRIYQILWDKNAKRSYLHNDIRKVKNCGRSKPRHKRVPIVSLIAFTGTLQIIPFAMLDLSATPDSFVNLIFSFFFPP